MQRFERSSTMYFRNLIYVWRPPKTQVPKVLASSQGVRVSSPALRVSRPPKRVSTPVKPFSVFDLHLHFRCFSLHLHLHLHTHHRSPSLALLSLQSRPNYILSLRTPDRSSSSNASSDALIATDLGHCMPRFLHVLRGQTKSTCCFKTALLSSEAP